ncbi:hypothetical protein IA929_04040 [Listeria seeligeri]|uniref:hypothetical protein n=1 Tax=Listeria seeligeri TaxID=1640 RepID=UPI001886E6E3|nr:hypothetical protein [Listeria seeligeri]MBF2599172.1 hypothetical protein [Listeria seeligeri]
MLDFTKDVFMNNGQVNDFMPQISNAEDTEKLDKIIASLKSFDKLEFLSRIAALRLYYENRDNAVLLDAITTVTINWLSNNEWDLTGISMSYGRFKRIINDINNLDISRNIDPTENPYVERILCYGNYNIITGINYSPTFNLQSIIDTLFISENRLTQQELVEYSQFIRENLNLSNLIIDAVIDEFKHDIEFTTTLFIPSQISLDRRANILLLDIPSSQVKDLMIDTIVNKNCSIDPFSQDEHLFLTKPYLECGGKMLVVDISAIASALSKSVTERLNTINKEEVLYQINETIWRKTCKYLSDLGHGKLKEEDLGIELISEGNYKESIRAVANNKILIAIGFLETWSKVSVDNNKINKRIKLILKKLNERGITNENIFFLMVPHTFNGKQPIMVNLNGIYNISTLSPNEIKAISINEGEEFFIPRFMKAKRRLKNSVINSSFGDFNLLCIYIENNYSFYANDEFDYRESTTFFLLTETGIYIEHANKKQEEKIFCSSIDCQQYNVFRLENSNVFMGDLHDKKIRFFIESSKEKKMEIITSEINTSHELDVYCNLIDCFSYWLDQYFKKVELKKNINISFNLSDDIRKYRVLDVEQVLSYDKFSFSNEKSVHIISVTALSYLSLGSTKDNFYEKELFIDILNYVIGGYELDIIEEIFSPSYKKKIVGKIMNENIEYSPLSIEKLSINESDINLLLDNLGSELKGMGYQIGAIPTADNSKICNVIVGYLYSLLEKGISKYNKEQLLKALYEQLELILYIQLWKSKNYYLDVVISPEKKDEILSSINDAAADSLALKFLIEYCSSTSIDGNENIGMWEIEELMAICSLILLWAHRSDLFKYNLVDTKLSMLPSNRIGMKHADFDNYNIASYNGRINQLAFDNNGLITNEELEKKKEAFFEMFNEDFNNFFDIEFGYSFEMFDDVIESLIGIGLNCGETIVCLPLENALNEVNKLVSGRISQEMIKKIIDDFGLCERADFLTPPEGFSKNDILPWRFNRNLSFIRKPIILYDSNVIWGIRNLSYLRKYLYNLIFSGTYKAQSKPMQVLMSKIANYLGEKFNLEVFQLLNSYPDVQVYKGVCKFGKKRITDENNNVLGDIDILLFNKKTKKIFVIETKDFNLSRNPYEIAMEIKKIFKGEKSFLAKHKKRENWVSTNLNVVLEHYDLPKGRWKVESMFIASEHIISRDLEKNNTRFLSIKELTAKTFR